MRQPKTAIALMGPTASGKTELALRLAQRFRIALISVDSAMVYRGMNIGTAKPGPHVLLTHPHALVDIRDPEDAYSVKEFVDDADREVVHALADARTPVLVGGTMLYFRSFRDGISTLPARDQSIRSRLQVEAEKNGVESLHKRLKKIDPQAASKIHPNNYVRIERALEVHEIAGRPMSEMQLVERGDGVANRLEVRLEEFSVSAMPRDELHERVERRLEQMFEAGLVEEVRTLMDRPNLHANSVSMSAVGYKQLWRYLSQCSANESEDDCKSTILYATRRIVRRQMTWLRHWPHLAGDRVLTAERAFEELCRRFTELGVQRN